MPVPRRRKSTDRKTSVAITKSVAEQLAELIPAPEASEERAALLGQISVLMQQRDSALKELYDLANIAKTLDTLRALSKELREATQALEDSVHTVKNFLSTTALPPNSY